jgi:hypothetical protein
MKREGTLLEKVRSASLRAIVAAGVIGLLTLNGLIGAAAYGYAFAAAMTDPDDDSDDDRR